MRLNLMDGHSDPRHTNKTDHLTAYSAQHRTGHRIVFSVENDGFRHVLPFALILDLKTGLVLVRLSPHAVGKDHAIGYAAAAQSRPRLLQAVEPLMRFGIRWAFAVPRNEKQEGENVFHFSEGRPS